PMKAFEPKRPDAMPLTRRAPHAPALRLRGRALPVTRALQRAPVGAVELAPDCRSALRERAHVAALLPPRAHDLAIEARELELQALHLEHRRIGLLAPSLDDQLGEQRLELGIGLELGALACGLAGCSAVHRVAQVALAQEPRCAPQPLAREALLEVQLRKRPRALFGRGDA